MSTAYPGIVSRTSFRNLWRQNWMCFLVMKKIIKVISLHLTNVMVIPKRNSKASMGNSRSMSQGTSVVNLNQYSSQNTNIQSSGRYHGREKRRWKPPFYLQQPPPADTSGNRNRKSPEKPVRCGGAAL